MLGVAALAGTTILLGLCSQPEPEPGSVKATATSEVKPIATPAALEPTPASTSTLPVSSNDARALRREARTHLDAGRQAEVPQQNA